MNSILKKNIQEITELCARHKVEVLYAFGSVLTDKFHQNSDVDLVVKFLPQDVLEYADNYFQLKFSIEKILERDIDLLEEKAIKNPFVKENINKTKYLLYG